MTQPIKPLAEQTHAADDLARLIGYMPEDVHDYSEVIAPFLAQRESALNEKIAGMAAALKYGVDLVTNCVADPDNPIDSFDSEQFLKESHAILKTSPTTFESPILDRVRAEAKAEAFEEVRYYCRGIFGDGAGAVEEFATRKIISLGGTFNDERKYSGIKDELRAGEGV